MQDVHKTPLYDSLDLYLSTVVAVIDNKFGYDYSKKNPNLVAAVMTAGIAQNPNVTCVK